MPIYEYRCEQGHTFEVMQRMSDEPLISCQACEARVQRVFHPVAVHFKGSGFYNTDYGTRKRAREKAESSDGASSTDSKSDSGTGSDSTSSGGEKSSSGGETSSGSDKKTSTAAASSSGD